MGHLSYDCSQASGGETSNSKSLGESLYLGENISFPLHLDGETTLHFMGKFHTFLPQLHKSLFADENLGAMYLLERSKEINCLNKPLAQKSLFSQLDCSLHDT